MKLEDYVHETLLAPEGGDRKLHIQDRQTAGVRASLLYNESRPEFYRVGHSCGRLSCNTECSACMVACCHMQLLPFLTHNCCVADLRQCHNSCSAVQLKVGRWHVSQPTLCNVHMCLMATTTAPCALSTDMLPAQVSTG